MTQDHVGTIVYTKQIINDLNYIRKIPFSIFIKIIEIVNKCARKNISIVVERC